MLFFNQEIYIYIYILNNLLYWFVYSLCSSNIACCVYGNQWESILAIKTILSAWMKHVDNVFVPRLFLNPAIPSCRVWKHGAIEWPEANILSCFFCWINWGLADFLFFGNSLGERPTVRCQIMFRSHLSDRRCQSFVRRMSPSMSLCLSVKNPTDYQTQGLLRSEMDIIWLGTCWRFGTCESLYMIFRTEYHGATSWNHIGGHKWVLILEG